MKTIHSDISKPCKAWFTFKNRAKILLLSTLIITGITIPSTAQEVFEKQAKPSWWFGAVAGANFNFYNGSTQKLNETMTPPLAFHNGFGLGLFAGPTIEYYRQNTMLGGMLQLGFDSRRGTFNQIITTCNCPADLSTKINYLTVEPSLRFAPAKNNFYLFAGPRIAYNLQKSFVYQLGINRADPTQEPTPEVTGDLSDMNKFLISMQVGAGIDIPISPQTKRTQLVVSPFVSFHPYFGQNPRSIETLNVTTIRAGAALKIGVGKKPEAIKPIDDVVVVPDGDKDKDKDKDVMASDVKFIIISPENIPAERQVRETFPLRNYVFFDLGSTEIPKRYVLLKKSEVQGFKEDQVELTTPENHSGRSKRQLIVYYNILNILGDRMVKNPNTTIKLVGSSEVSAADGRKMAESVKTYLIDVFAIDASRITTEGRDKPKIPSSTKGTAEELVMLSEGDRRVSIESSSPLLLMEFQSGPSAPLKPIEIALVEEAPADSYVSFENRKAEENFTSWNIEITDDKGVMQKFGPYTEELVTIPGKDILGKNTEGYYKVKMIGTTKKGKKVEKEANVHMVLWVPSKTEVTTRFSVIYEYNESNAIALYDKYLTDIVVNKIPQNGRVIIRGHTDIIGDSKYNARLSLRRANDVKKTLEAALAKQGRSDVTFEVIGLGDNQRLSPFANKYPEERFYNRSVVIDILPAKQ